MREEKHNEALAEVNTYIDESLKFDLLRRQRLLMMALSLGMQHLVELWLHKSGAIKHGAQVKHEFFKSGEKKLRLKLSGMLSKDIKSLKNSSRILSIARDIELDRDDIIYGSPLKNDAVLREKINKFFELKKSIKESVGDIL